MKIAVPYENGAIFQHFGHTQQFKIYHIENGEITGSEIADTNGSGHGALAQFLSHLAVDALICGGIGAGAQNAPCSMITLFPELSTDFIQPAAVI